MCATHADEARAVRPPGAPRRLALPDVLRALDSLPALPREVVPSTRGEPLLWEGLPGLVHACGERRILLNVTTNGSFPLRGAESWAWLLCPMTSDVKVSWGASDQTLDRQLLGGRDPDRALADLRTLLRVREEVASAGGNRCAVSLQVAAREENLTDLTDIVRMAAAEGIDRVKVNHLQVHFPSQRGASLRRSAEAARRWNRAAVACVDTAATTARRGGGQVELTGLVDLPEDGSPPPRGTCPFAGREAWVEVDGRYLPCPAPAARDGLLPWLGSLSTVPLGEAWRGDAWRRLADGWPDLTPCADCSFRSPGGA